MKRLIVYSKHRNQFQGNEGLNVEKYSQNIGEYLLEFVVKKDIYNKIKNQSTKEFVKKLYYIKLDTPLQQKHY